MSRKRGLAASASRFSFTLWGSRPVNMEGYSSARRASAKRTAERAGDSRFSTMVPRSRNDERSQNWDSTAESTGLNGFSSNGANSVAR